MRDGISIARQGTPAVALVTEMFWPQGDFVAAAAGMPGIPRIQPPSRRRQRCRRMSVEADRIADNVLAILRGPTESPS